MSVTSAWHTPPALSSFGWGAKPRGPGAPGAAAGHQLGFGRAQLSALSGGTVLRVYMRNHMVTSSSCWATRRVTSSAVQLPHRCEMQCSGGRSKQAALGHGSLGSRLQSSGQNLKSVSFTIMSIHKELLKYSWDCFAA